MDLHYGVAQTQRNVEIIETLLNVARKTARVGHQLANGVHLCTLQCHTARHDQTDVARAENDNFFAGEIPFEVDVLLRCARAVNACRTCACNVERSAGALTASHCQNDGFCLELEYTAFGVGSSDYAVGSNVKHHSAKHKGDVLFVYFFFITPSVFGACQLLTKAVEAEAVVNALLQNAAELFIALQNQKVANACLMSRQSCTHAGRAAANDDKIDLSHYSAPPLVFCTLMRDLPPHLVTSS